MSRTVSIREAAEMFGVSKTTIEDAISRGRLVRVGHVVTIGGVSVQELKRLAGERGWKEREREGEEGKKKGGPSMYEGVNRWYDDV